MVPPTGSFPTSCGLSSVPTAGAALVNIFLTTPAIQALILPFFSIIGPINSSRVVGRTVYSTESSPSSSSKSRDGTSDEASALEAEVAVLGSRLSTSSIAKDALAHAGAVDVELLGRVVGLVEVELVADEAEGGVVIRLLVA